MAKWMILWAFFLSIGEGFAGWGLKVSRGLDFRYETAGEVGMSFGLDADYLDDFHGGRKNYYWGPEFGLYYLGNLYKGLYHGPSIIVAYHHSEPGNENRMLGLLGVKFQYKVTGSIALEADYGINLEHQWKDSLGFHLTRFGLNMLGIAFYF